MKAWLSKCIFSKYRIYLCGLRVFLPCFSSVFWIHSRNNPFKDRYRQHKLCNRNLFFPIFIERDKSILVCRRRARNIFKFASKNLIFIWGVLEIIFRIVYILKILLMMVTYLTKYKLNELFTFKIVSIC